MEVNLVPCYVSLNFFQRGMEIMEGAITIERLSSAVSKLCYIAIAVMPLILVWIWVDPEKVGQDFSDTSDLVLP